VADDAATRHIVFVGRDGNRQNDDRTSGRGPALGRAFVDNDELLERTDRINGRRARRARRRRCPAPASKATTVLDALHAHPPAVIAAAASTIEEPLMRSALRDLAWCAWLRADARNACHAYAGVRGAPVRGADPALLVAERAQRRDRRYSEVADAEFWTDRAHSDQVVSEVLAAVRRQESIPDTSVRDGLAFCHRGFLTALQGGQTHGS